MIAPEEKTPPGGGQKADPVAYRPDVDGLRAIAVLSVIVYHIWPDALPGGFVGVDIFFVISGFLISLQIFRQSAANTFSIADFYRRRIKRIAPAMLAVLAITIISSQLLLRPTDAEAVARSGLWTLLSLANVYFWLYEDNSYFAAATDEIPLLHYWSLGVEEQFYLLWPVVLILAGKRVFSRSFVAVLLATIAFSCLLAERYFSADPSFVYYMLPARAGELMMGALAARWAFDAGMPVPTGKRFSPLAIAGMLLVAGSLFLISGERPFPGLQAIPPTAGTAMLLVSGHLHDTLPKRLLKLKPLVFVGLISYSAYLWHWPILAFLRYANFVITPIVGATIIAATIGLATLTYRYIETPFRKSRRPLRAIALRQYAIPSALIFIVIAAALKTDGKVLRALQPAYAERLEAVQSTVRPAHGFPFICQKQRITREDFINDDCLRGKPSESAKRVLLFGDSIAAQYVGMLSEFALDAEFEFRNVAVGLCPPVRDGIAAFTPHERVADCNASAANAWEAFGEYDVIILAAGWSFYQGISDAFIPAVFRTVNALRHRGKTVVIIGESPSIPGYDRLCREKAVGFPFVKCRFDDVLLDPDIKRVNTLLREFAASNAAVSYYDANDRLCPDDVCRVLGPDGNPLYFDAYHLSLPASVQLGRQIVRESGVPVSFQRLANTARNETR